MNQERIRKAILSNSDVKTKRALVKKLTSQDETDLAEYFNSITLGEYFEILDKIYGGDINE